MKLIKTGFVFTFLSLFFISAFAQTKNEIPIRTNRISEKILVLTEDSPLENIVVAIASKKGLVVVDVSGCPITAAKMREIIVQEFGRSDFAYVINTHYHWDHTWGNMAFNDVSIIGHEKCIKKMHQDQLNLSQYISKYGQIYYDTIEKLKNLPPNSEEKKILTRDSHFYSRVYQSIKDNFKIIPPNITFKDRLNLYLDDITMELIYFGNAHSDCDILIKIPEEKLLLTGDLFLERGWLPFFNKEIEIDVPRWIKVLSSVLDDKTTIKHVIPGHKDIWPREKLVLWQNYIVELWEGLVDAEAKGLDLESVIEKFPFDQKFSYLKEYGHTDAKLQNFHNNNIISFWRQLKKSVTLILENIITESGIDAAIEKYNEIKSLNSSEYFIEEYAMQNFGYKLLNNMEVEYAIEIFKLNVETFPNSWKVYNSLGDAYMKNRNFSLAIVNFKKSIKLNPDNKHGKEMLLRLEERQH